MVRSLVILLLLSATCHAEWFTGTNADGRVVSVPVRTDPSLAYVVGAISTSSMPYEAVAELVPVQSPPLELPYIVLTDDNGAGYGVIVDGGDLLTVLDHASPRPSEAIIRKRIQQARADRAALRQDARTVRTNMANLATSSTTAASQGQQIEELRKAVRDLAAIIRKQLKDN